MLGRHAGVALGSADVFVNVAGGVRIDEPGADLAVALAIASAAKGIPVKSAVAAFGEIGLTGRLRPATQVDRRLEECAKLGLRAAVAPGDTPGARSKSLRVVASETVREAIAAALWRVRPRRWACDSMSSAASRRPAVSTSSSVTPSHSTRRTR